MHEGEASQPTVGCHEHREGLLGQHLESGGCQQINNCHALESPMELLKHTDAWVPTSRVWVYLTKAM